MIKVLTIENIILIKRTTLHFEGGLCVLTGETGAGKSIILNSILTLFGKETKSKALVRQGCKYGAIEGIFDNIPEETEKLLIQHAITPDSELKIKCIIQENGAITSFINNEQVPAEVIKQVGETLIEVNRQHEQTYLMEEKNHISILDDYASSSELLLSLEEVYRKIQICEREIQETITRNKQIAFEIDYLKEAQKEIKEAEIEEKEYEDLQEKRIQNKKKHNTFQTLTSASSKLEQASVGQILMNIHRMISPIVALNLNTTDSQEKPQNEMENLSETIDRICIDIQEVESAIESLIQQNYINIAEIDKDEERFFFLQDLAKKYKTQPFELHQHLIEITKKIDGFNKTEESIVELTKQQKVLEAQYFEIAKKLSALRTIAAKNLSEKVNESLKALQMEGACFDINIEQGKMRKNGIDIVSFMIETNKNMGFDRLSKIASGGEISRIVLAIKAAIVHLRQIPCVIFDEIDSGISGKTSDSVGKVMLKLAQSVQIIVITHQPQVAAKAHDHFRITKTNTENKTTNTNETETTVEKLTNDERVHEIARLLSGANISDEAISNAKILLN
jgi:DNA repair protein RecN (Recombination protein N)